MRLKLRVVIPIHRMVWGKLGTESLSSLLKATQLGNAELGSGLTSWLLASIALFSAMLNCLIFNYLLCLLSSMHPPLPPSPLVQDYQRSNVELLGCFFLCTQPQVGIHHHL